MTARSREAVRARPDVATRATRLAVLLLATLAGACATPPPTASAPPPPGAMPAAVAAPATPPAPAAGTAFALVNPGFESAAFSTSGDPVGWYSFQHAGDKSYRFVVDADVPRSGQRSLRIENIGPEPYGAIAQIVDARPHAGTVARLTGWMRTRDAADGGAGLTLLVLAGGATLDQNFMYDAPVQGTTGWRRFTITLPVPKGADRLEVGAMLRGRGALWLDDVELAFVSP